MALRRKQRRVCCVISCSRLGSHSNAERTAQRRQRAYDAFPRLPYKLARPLDLACQIFCTTLYAATAVTILLAPPTLPGVTVIESISVLTKAHLLFSAAATLACAVRSLACSYAERRPTTWIDTRNAVVRCHQEAALQHVRAAMAKHPKDSTAFEAIMLPPPFDPSKPAPQLPAPIIIPPGAGPNVVPFGPPLTRRRPGHSPQ